jgi:hypothetical protein
MKQIIEQVLGALENINLDDTGAVHSLNGILADFFSY